MPFACSRAMRRAGRSIARSTVMMPRTTSSSTSVKARRCGRRRYIEGKSFKAPPSRIVHHSASANARRAVKWRRRLAAGILVEHVEGGAEVLGERGGELHLRAVGVRDAEAFGVEREAVDQGALVLAADRAVVALEAAEEESFRDGSAPRGVVEGVDDEGEAD